MQTGASLRSAASCSGDVHEPITSGVNDEQVWIFARGDERLCLRRTSDGQRCFLGVDGVGDPRAYEFPDIDALQRFQEDFEKLLLGTGWTFVSFSPDRRRGRERRHFSRLLTDRRRWWTDTVPRADRSAHAEPREPRRRSRSRSRH